MPQAAGTKEGRMERTLETWLAMPLATFEEIAAASGVSDKTFYRYRQDASFMAEYSRRQKQRFAALEGKAIALLEEQMENRNWNAIKYTLDGTGYKPTDKVEVQQTTISVSIDEEDE